MGIKITSRGYAKITMWIGIVTTLGGNAAAADWNDSLGVLISMLPAISLAAVFEMTTRGRAIPSRRRWYHRAARLLPSLAIMGIAAYTSYGHLLTTALAHGQHGLAARLMALLPDAMMLLATVVLKDSPQARATTATAPAMKKAPVKKAPAKSTARKPATAKTPAVKVTAPAAPATGRRLSLVPALS